MNPFLSPVTPNRGTAPPTPSLLPSSNVFPEQVDSMSPSAVLARNGFSKTANTSTFAHNMSQLNSPQMMSLGSPVSSAPHTHQQPPRHSHSQPHTQPLSHVFPSPLAQSVFSITLPSVLTTATSTTHTPLTYTLYVGSQSFQQIHHNHSTGVTGMSGRSMWLTLTSPLTHTFLHLVEITDSMFARIKSQQELLVDYLAFPEYLIALLTECSGESRFNIVVDTTVVNIVEQRQNNHNVNALNSTMYTQPQQQPPVSSALSQSAFFNQSSHPQQPQPQPPLPAVPDMPPPQWFSHNVTRLSVCESSQYKNIQHLSVDMSVGTDEQVKGFLADLLSQSQQSCSSLRQQNASLTSQLDASHSQLAQTEHQLSVSLKSHAEEVVALSSEHQRETESLTHSLAERETSLRVDCDNRVSELSYTHDAEMRRLVAELNKLKALFDEQVGLVSHKSLTNQQLQEANRDLGATVSRLKSQVDEDGLKRAAIESHVQSINRELDALRTKTTIQEAQMTQQEHSLSEAASLARQERDRHSQMTEAANTLRQNNFTLESQLASSIAEIGKANTVIALLQKEVTSLRTKLKQRHAALHAARDLHTTLSANHSEALLKLTAVEGELKSVRGLLAAKETEAVETKSQNDGLQKTLAEQGRMVSWLNDELDKAHTANTQQQAVNIAAKYKSPAKPVSNTQTPHTQPLQTPPSSAIYPSGAHSKFLDSLLSASAEKKAVNVTLTSPIKGNTLTYPLTPPHTHTNTNTQVNSSNSSSSSNGKSMVGVANTINQLLSSINLDPVTPTAHKHTHTHSTPLVFSPGQAASGSSPNVPRSDDNSHDHSGMNLFSVHTLTASPVPLPRQRPLFSPTRPSSAEVGVKSGPSMQVVTQQQQLHINRQQQQLQMLQQPGPKTHTPQIQSNSSESPHLPSLPAPSIGLVSPSKLSPSVDVLDESMTMVDVPKPQPKPHVPAVVNATHALDAFVPAQNSMYDAQRTQDTLASLTSSYF